MRKPYEETCGDSGEEELTFKRMSPSLQHAPESVRGMLET